MRRLLALVPMLLVLAGCGSTAYGPPQEPAQALETRPNIVFVLVDDLQTDLLKYMPNVLGMASAGAYFENFIVSDSRCCPSRASILTGQLPHNSGVYTNSPPLGGHKAFVGGGASQRTFAIALRDRGYRTALFGKYINGYSTAGDGVPSGWTDWAASARAYQGFDYTLNIDGTPRNFGERPDDYLTDVIAERGDEFVSASVADRRPFFLELSTFTPHIPAVPAPRHLGLVPNLKAPRSPAFNRRVSRAPRWLAIRKRIKRPQINEIDARYRNQVRSMISVDEMVGRLRDRLEALGIADETYFFFTSDNGFHMGEHRLLPGKMTAFDEDIRVPLLVTGPGVPAGQQVEALVQNTDLAPTFEELGGGTERPEVDGRSLVDLMHGGSTPADWRLGALVEHRAEAKSKFNQRDPDDQPPASGNPPGYSAMRTPRGTYVEYSTGEREFYDLTVDPDELDNAYASLTRGERRNLSEGLAYLLSCRGTGQCATATPPVRRAARAAASGRRSARRR